MTHTTERKRQRRTERERANSTGSRLEMPAVALGIGLSAVGLARRSRGGLVLAAIGVWLCYRGLRAQPDGRAQLETDLASLESDAPFRFDPEPAVEQSITIDRSPEELFDRWLDPMAASQALWPVAEVSTSDPDVWIWRIRGPFGWEHTWTTEIVESEPDEFVRWESHEDAAIPCWGAIRFREVPGDRGTAVTIAMDFDPPGGAIGDALVRRAGLVPETLAASALRRFKSLVETGEVPRSRESPSTR